MSAQGFSVPAGSSQRMFLSRSPLVRVLTQVRWPALAAFDLDAVAKSMSLRLATDYPLASKDAEMQVVLTQDGVQQQRGAEVHRFLSVDEKWKIALGDTFLSFETSAYSSHADFLARFEEVVDALLTAVSIPIWIRFGYRYTNRLVEAQDLSRITQYFDPAVTGNLSLKRPGEIVQSISESLYRENDTFLLVRVADLPAGGSIDPSIAGVPGRSWILDLDAYDEQRSVGFTREMVSAKATQLARVAYDYFKGVVTPEFEARFK